MTKEEAIYKAKHLRKVRPNICVDAEDFWDTVIAALEQEPCENVPDTNIGNIYKCSCGYGWDKSKVVRHHFCPNCGMAVDERVRSVDEPVDEPVVERIVDPEDCICRWEVLDLLHLQYFGKDLYMKICALSSVKPSKMWIPVSERLPEEDGCYLVTTTGTNNDIIDIAYYTDGIWHKASRIKAWMPLPTPYQSASPTSCSTCILDNTDACTRGAGRAVDDEACEDYLASPTGAEGSEE